MSLVPTRCYPSNPTDPGWWRTTTALTMIARFGMALILIGVIAVIVFAITASIQQGNINTLLFGAGSSILGFWILRRSTNAPHPRANRFRLLRRVSNRVEDE